jgi:hypothetical protein
LGRTESHWITKNRFAVEGHLPFTGQQLLCAV